jgi:hypothetical protein
MLLQLAQAKSCNCSRIKKLSTQGWDIVKQVTARILLIFGISFWRLHHNSIERLSSTNVPVCSNLLCIPNEADFPVWAWQDERTMQQPSLLLVDVPEPPLVNRWQIVLPFQFCLFPPINYKSKT